VKFEISKADISKRHVRSCLQTSLGETFTWSVLQCDLASWM